MEIKKFDSVKKMKKTTANPGDYAVVNNKVYMYVNNIEGWKLFNPKGQQIELNQNAYTMAQTVAAQAPAMTAETLQQKKSLITEFLNKNNNNKYFMLLLKDISYYTLFVSKSDSDEKISDVIIECLQNLGTIIDIDDDENGNAIEIWVKDSNNEAHIGYFFPYDEGVIECQLQ